MPVFQFEAVERDGRIATGTLSAVDSDAVARQLQERGAVPLSIVSGQAGAGGLSRVGRSLPSAKLSRFARELALLLDAGLRLDKALESVIKGRDLKAMSPALTVVLEEVRAGVPFSEALERRPEIAPPYAIGMIRAGEAAGALATILRSLADLADRRAKSTKAVRAAMTYPAILAVTAAVSIGTLFTVVLPQLEPLFDGAGDRLPAVTVGVLIASRLFREYGLFALGALVLAGIALRMSFNAPETRGRSTA
jgi:general secretion pathway protein F